MDSVPQCLIHEPPYTVRVISEDHDEPGLNLPWLSKWSGYTCD